MLAKHARLPESFGFFSRGAAEGAERREVKTLDDITGAIVDGSVKIHKELGPGFTACLRALRASA